MDARTILQQATLFDSSYERYRLDAFSRRQFSPEHLRDLLSSLAERSAGALTVEQAGTSFEGKPIIRLSIGTGPIGILLWSQMHGDESTATMAIADILHYLVTTRDEAPTTKLLSSLTMHFVPILNPDGAARFQRRTAQGIDMNRDALALQTPEARLLKELQHTLRPHVGFNLHDQELSTINQSKELTAIALLAPAFDHARSTNEVHQRAKALASVIAESLEPFAGGHIARYDDTYEPRAFGDSMQRWGTSTVLVESGHARDDPEKQSIRRLNYSGLLSCFASLAAGREQSADIARYENLPLNGKRAYDLIIRNVRVRYDSGQTSDVDLGISYQVDTHSEAPPKLVDLGDLSTFIGLKEIDAGGTVVSFSRLPLGMPIDWEGLFRF